MKPIFDEKDRVIGLLYKGPKMNTQTTLSEAQVRSRLGIYQERLKKGNKSRNVTDGIDLWTYALNLFDTKRHPAEAVSK